MKKLVFVAAMVASVLVAAAPAMTQNVASVESTQVLQQVGGDQYGDTVVATGEGDAASADNQEFSATQVQQSAAIAGSGNAAAQNVGSGGAEADVADVHPDDSGDDDNFASVDSTQILQQVGGDQYGDAVISTGSGDAASADNQEFEATQVQQSLAIAGEGNAAAQNADIEPASTDDDSAPLIDQSESSDGGDVFVVQSGDTLSEIAAVVGTSVEALVADNDIEDPDLIFPGQVLVL